MGRHRRDPHPLFRGGGPDRRWSWSSEAISDPTKRPSSAIVWNRNFDALAERFHVVAFDKLGQGHTDNPPNDDYTMNAVVQHANGFIRALGLSDVHLAGHSRGGYLVCRLTLEQPELVASCTIVDSNTLRARPRS